MARAESMAAIDAVLHRSPNISGGAANTTTSPATPHVAPGVTTPTPLSSAGTLTADEKRYIDAQRQAQGDIERQAEKDEQQQQQRENAFDRSANATVNAASGILRGTGLTLASLPTPGELILPLSILLVFFFLLLPVNGHTRLVWIWLVLTGNAEIQQQAGSTDNSSGIQAFGSGAGASFADNAPANNATVITAGNGAQFYGGGAGASFADNSSPNNGTPILNNVISNLLPIITATGVEDIL